MCQYLNGNHEYFHQIMMKILLPNSWKAVLALWLFTSPSIVHCKQKLSLFKVPKKIIFVDELPKTPTGKILKRDMRKQYKDIF